MDASPSASSSTLMERSTSRLGALLGRAAGGDLAVASKSIETEFPSESSSRTMPSAPPSENVVTSAPASSSSSSLS